MPYSAMPGGGWCSASTGAGTGYRPAAVWRAVLPTHPGPPWPHGGGLKPVGGAVDAAACPGGGQVSAAVGRTGCPGVTWRSGGSPEVVCLVGAVWSGHAVTAGPGGLWATAPTPGPITGVGQVTGPLGVT